MKPTAIDVHVHLSDEKTLACNEHILDQMGKYFGRRLSPVPLDDMAQQYRSREMMAIILTVTDEAVTGVAPVSNAHIAACVKKHPDVLMGFGAIDPLAGDKALDEISRIKDLGLHGIGELHPGRQHFFPNDPRFYPLWERAQKLELPVLFHTGMAAVGAGTPGGMGVKLKYTSPIHLDDVAADFPRLKIIGAHPAWPWQDEALAIARHKANYFIDLSGWAPKYFPSELVKQANSILQDKVLFGSDWPSMSVERWLEEFSALDIKPEVRRKIMLDNARSVLGLK